MILFNLQQQLGIAERNIVSDNRLDLVINLLRTRYADLTIKDFDNAMLMLFSEELRDQQNAVIVADSHFQQFSAAFISKILNAYRRHKLKAAATILKLMPADEERVSEEQIAKINRHWLQTVCDVYADFIDDADACLMTHAHLLSEIYITLEEHEVVELKIATKKRIFAQASETVKYKELNLVDTLKASRDAETVAEININAAKASARREACVIAFRYLRFTKQELEVRRDKLLSIEIETE